MSIKTNTTLKDFDGNIIKDNKGDDRTLGKLVAQILVSQPQSKDPLRSYTLSQKYYDGGDIEESDIPFVEEAVKSTAIFTPLVTGQILKALKSE